MEPPTIIPGSRRPDGTFRKEIRVRPGYIPPDEAIRYKNANVAAFEKAKARGPPGLSPSLASVSSSSSSIPASRTASSSTGQFSDDGKSKSAIKNAKKRANKAAALGNVEAVNDGAKTEVVDTLTETKPSGQVKPATSSSASDNPESNNNTVAEMEKRLRALNKKYRQILDIASKDSETLLPEQREKLSKQEEVEKELEQLQRAIDALQV